MFGPLEGWGLSKVLLMYVNGVYRCFSREVRNELSVGKREFGKV